MSNQNLSRKPFDIPAINNQREVLKLHLGLDDETAASALSELPSVDKSVALFEYQGAYYHVGHQSVDSLKGKALFEFNSSWWAIVKSTTPALPENTTSSHILDCQTAYAKKVGPRLGDFVRIGENLERIAVITHRLDAVQVTLPKSGAWFLGKGGYQDFSGTAINFSHDRKFDLIPMNQLKQVGTQEGTFWTFKDGVVQAGNRQDFHAECRVFDFKEEA